jgi:hypothetical protein
MGQMKKKSRGCSAAKSSALFCNVFRFTADAVGGSHFINSVCTYCKYSSAVEILVCSRINLLPLENHAQYDKINE